MSLSIAGALFFGGIATVISRWRAKNAGKKGGIVLKSADKLSKLVLRRLNPYAGTVLKAIDQIERALDDDKAAKPAGED